MLGDAALVEPRPWGEVRDDLGGDDDLELPVDGRALYRDGLLTTGVNRGIGEIEHRFGQGELCGSAAALQ